MTPDTQGSAINGMSGAVASEAALMATFYCRRGVVPTRALHEQLYRSLARAPEKTTPSDWHDPENNTFLRRFDPPAAYDTTVIQLTLNASGGAASAWEDMRQRLEKLLDVPDLSNAWWGYTLTYQAVLSPDLSPDVSADLALSELPPAIRWLHSSENLQPLTQADMAGGSVWLLDIPQGDGLEAATVYVALSPPDKEETLVKAIYGPDAILLMPDLIAHKGYHQMRQYRGGDLLSRFEEHIADLQENTRRLLMSNQARTVGKMTTSKT